MGVALLNVVFFFAIYGLVIGLVKYFVRVTDIFVLKTSFDRQVTEFQLEPHYPWYLTLIRHILIIILILVLLGMFGLSNVGYALIVNAFFLVIVILLIAYIATMFWAFTSEKIDRDFHEKKEKIAQEKRICYTSSHTPISDKEFHRITIYLSVATVILIIIGLAVWLDIYL